MVVIGWSANKNAKRQYKKTIQNRRFFFNSLIDVKLQPFKITGMQKNSHAKESLFLFLASCDCNSVFGNGEEEHTSKTSVSCPPPARRNTLSQIKTQISWKQGSPFAVSCFGFHISCVENYLPKSLVLSEEAQTICLDIWGTRLRRRLHMWRFHDSWK